MTLIAQVTQPAAESPAPAAQNPLDFGLAGWVMALTFLLIVVVTKIADSGAGKSSHLTTARWAKPADKQAARRTAHRQLKGGRHDEVTLWINAPKEIAGTAVRGDRDTVWLPHMERGTAVIGGSGSGKSYSVIKPTLRAAIAQGLPTALLDTDYPGLTKTIAPLAKAAGYDVFIFAPGFPESRICNVLDFIGDSRDATAASQISKTLNKNFSVSPSRAEDPFFSVAGELATEAAFLLAKAMPYPDILQAFAILKDDKMVERVKHVGAIDQWLSLSFGQLLSTARSEKTVDSIRGTAAILLGQLMRPDILPTLIGKSTLPINITGKRLIIFGVKQDIRMAVSPLIASVINAIVTRNILPGRKEPLFLSLDEMPSMYFPEIADWLSEKRKYGLCTQIGYQSLGQLENTYGKELAQVIFTNTATKFLFNPQAIESAKIFSSMLGETDVVYKTLSRSAGKGSSRTRAEHRARKSLFTPDEFMGLDAGSCVLLSPGYGSKKRKFVPTLFDPLQIIQRELDIQQETEARWHDFLQDALKGGVGNQRIAPTEIDKRVEAFHNALPVVSAPPAAPLSSFLSR